MHRSSILSAGLAIVVGMGACGGGDDRERVRATQPPAAAATGDPERYCGLVRRMDAAGEKFFAGLDRDMPPRKMQALERRFVTRYSPRLAEIERAAPRRIRADVGVLVAAMRTRAGLEAVSPVDQRQASAAERRIHAYEKRHCAG